MTLNSFLALWVGFMGTLVHLISPLCPLLGTMQMPPWALVCTFTCRTSCDLLFLEYPAFTLHHPRNRIVGRIPLAPFGAGKQLGYGVAAHAILSSSTGSDFSALCQVCMLSTLSSRGARGPSLRCHLYSPISKDDNVFSCSSVTWASFLGKCLSNSDPVKTDLPSYYPPLVPYGF